MEKFNHKRFQWILGANALILAGMAAIFSIFGLSNIYVGAGVLGYILFGGIELGKLVVVSYLYRYWKTISWARKSFLVLITVIVMLLTSGGIYGFLSESFKSTTISLETSKNKIEVVENKKNIFVNNTDNIKEQINYRSKRVVQLSDLRNQQEVRLDTLYQRGNFASAKATETNIKETNKIIQNLNSEVDSLNIQMMSLNDSIGNYDLKLIDIKSNQYEREVIILKHLSSLTGLKTETIFNIFTIFIIVVFDPMAIALLLAFNHIGVLMIRQRKKEDEDEEDKIEPETPPIVPFVEETVPIKIVEEPIIETELEPVFETDSYIPEHQDNDIPDYLNDINILNEKLVKINDEKQQIQNEFQDYVEKSQENIDNIKLKLEEEIREEMQEKVKEEIEKVKEELIEKHQKPHKKVIFRSK